MASMARQLQPQDIPVRVTLPTKEIFVVYWMCMDLGCKWDLKL
jgi:hypothetical protein